VSAPASGALQSLVLRSPYAAGVGVRSRAALLGAVDVFVAAMVIEVFDRSA
jgi:hypothetical protein